MGLSVLVYPIVARLSREMQYGAAPGAEVQRRSVSGPGWGRPA